MKKYVIIEKKEDKNFYSFWNFDKETKYSRCTLSTSAKHIVDGICEGFPFLELNETMKDYTQLTNEEIDDIEEVLKEYLRILFKKENFSWELRTIIENEIMSYFDEIVKINTKVLSSKLFCNSKFIYLNIEKKQYVIYEVLNIFNDTVKARALFVKDKGFLNFNNSVIDFKKKTLNNINNNFYLYEELTEEQKKYFSEWFINDYFKKNK